MKLESICAYALAVVAGPLLIGLINRTKAVFAGRRGQPMLQLYHDGSSVISVGFLIGSSKLGP